MGFPWLGLELWCGCEVERKAMVILVLIELWTN